MLMELSWLDLMLGVIEMQSSFSELEYAAKRKVTRRDRFLAEIEAITPWAELERTLIPFYPSNGGCGRPPIGLSRMLRMYVAQQCFGLSDEGIEDALYNTLQAFWMPFAPAKYLQSSWPPIRHTTS